MKYHIPIIILLFIISCSSQHNTVYSGIKINNSGCDIPTDTIYSEGFEYISGDCGTIAPQSTYLYDSLYFQNCYSGSVDLSPTTTSMCSMNVSATDCSMVGYDNIISMDGEWANDWDSYYGTATLEIQRGNVFCSGVYKISIQKF